MRRTVLTALGAVLLALLLPLLLPAPRRGEPELQPPVQQAVQEEQIRVLLPDGSVQTMSRSDYLWGVTAAEMPAGFHEEALKAQCVAAYTYYLSLPRDKHPGAQVCAHSGCCQAYISREEARANWGDRAGEYEERIGRAVEGTRGLAITYEGRPIQALFFSSAPGSTVDAAAVWGTHVPYLVSVSSPEGDQVPNYHSTLTLSAGELSRTILAQYPQADLTGPCAQWLTEVEREPSGVVSRVRVGGVELTGGQLRKLLGLRSACFTLSVREDEVTFHVTGYGHGVGMSQYGADRLARQGRSFEEILRWYYTGVEVEQVGVA